MNEWFDSKSTSGVDPRVWQALCPQDTYWGGPASELPAPYFSSGLISKVDTVVMVNSGPLFMVNFYRRDGTAIDQQPFGFVFLSGSPSLSGGFIQHGDWPGRTTTQPLEVAKAIAESGIGHGQLFSGNTTKRAGHVSDLAPSVRAAFDKLASYLSGCLSLRTSN